MTPVSITSALNHLADRVRVVRQWLWTLKCLQVTSIALACLSGAVLLCWGLSWGLGWQVAGHCLAGAVLLCLTAGAVLWITHVSARSMTYSDSAAAIETHQTMHRQLVTAMEYYENQTRFPYSRGLTHHMIRRVSQRSGARDFGDCVPRRKIWVYSSIIAVECLVLFGFLISESAFWVRQWGQSVQAAEAADVGPGSEDAEALTAVTSDILTEPNTLVTFEAQAGPEAEETVRFVLQRKDPNGGPGDTVFSCDVSGVPDPDTGMQQFTVERFCESPDEYQYRFESTDKTTDWSDLTVLPRPQLTAMMSQVTRPEEGAESAEWQPVEHGSVDVVAGSDVSLKIQTDQPLSKVEVRQDGKVIETLTPNGSEATYQCRPEASQSLTFTPVNEQGQAMEEPIYVELEVKVDQPPHIELLVPEGDLPLIEPVPVEVTFKISDDLGLASAALCYEWKNRPEKRLEMVVADQAKEVELTRTLPLDQWRLVEGDTVMFFCRATDVPLDPCVPAQEAVSEITLIEIQREIKIKEPSENKNSMFAETLMDALEYIRAIVKKTWTLSHVTNMTPIHFESIQALVGDLAHTERVIEQNRDNPEMGFSDEDKAVLTQVVDMLSEAESALGTSKLADAVEAEKKGYRRLRDFLKEQDRTPQQSPPAPKPETPEKIKVQSEPEQPPMSEQEAESELQNLQKQLESLTQQQKQLKKALEKTLASQSQGPTDQDSASGDTGQGAPDQNSSTPAGQPSNSGQPGSQSEGASESSQSSPGQGQGQSPSDQGQGQGQGQSPSGQGQGQGQGQSPSGQGQGQGQGQSPSGQGQGGNQGQGQTQGQGQGRGQGQSGQGSSQGRGSGQPGSPMSQGGAQASPDARLAMLQAKQRVLKSMADQIEEALDRVAQVASGPEADSSRRAAQHLNEASDVMDQVQSQLDPLEGGVDHAELSERMLSRDTLNQILDQLDLADTAMDDALLDSELDRQIKQAQKMTDQLMEDVEAMTQAPQDVDEEAMKRRLENAERLLDNLTQAQSTVVRKGQRGQGMPTGLALTDYQATSPSQAARQMVQRLWTAVMALNQTEGRAIETPVSVSQFWESENAFYERASQYQSEEGKQ